jgi:hypothetical protein
MKKYEHLRKKALIFRKDGFSLREICERLNLSKSSVYYWIKDIPLQRPRRVCCVAAGIATKEKFKKLRDAAYNEGVAEADTLFKNILFRDFIIAYMCEGYKKNRNAVCIANSDPDIIKLGYYWIKKLAKRKVDVWLQYHCDQNLDGLKSFWAKELGIRRGTIGVQRKSNSGKLAGRNWSSKFGVLSVRTSDTYFRSKIDAWINYIKNSWKNGV